METSWHRWMPRMNLGTACCLTSYPRAVPITSALKLSITHLPVGWTMDTVFPPCPAPSHPQCKSCSLITGTFPSMALLPGQPVSLLLHVRWKQSPSTSTTQTGLIPNGCWSTWIQTHPMGIQLTWTRHCWGACLVGHCMLKQEIPGEFAQEHCACTWRLTPFHPRYRWKPFPLHPAQRYCNFTGLAAMHRPGCIITRWITRSMPVHGSPYPMTYHPPKPPYGTWLILTRQLIFACGRWTMPGMQAPTRSPEQ